MLVAALSAALVAGCDRSNGTAGTTTTTTFPPSSSTTASSEEAAVLDGYRCFRRAFEAASNPMNPEHSDLGACATGDVLRNVTSRFLARRAAGEIYKGTVELAPQVVDVSADRAVVHDCIFDRMGVYDASNPEVLKEPMDTERVFEVVTLVKVEGRWKVAAITPDEESKGCTPAR